MNDDSIQRSAPIQLGFEYEVRLIGGETRHTIQKHYTGVGYTLTIDNHKTAWLWDGEPKYQTASGYVRILEVSVLWSTDPDEVSP